MATNKLTKCNKLISFQLRRIVGGYTGVVNCLNDELLAQLEIKDDLSTKQDAMLEHISELSLNLI